MPATVEPRSDEAVAESTYFIPAESVTGPAGAVYQKQLAAEQAEDSYRAELGNVQARHADAMQAGHPLLTQPWDNPVVVALRQEADRLQQIAREAQAEIGGVVMCVETSYNLPKVQQRMTALSKRAVKLGLDPITFKVTDEKVILNYEYSHDLDRSFYADFEHVYCILAGGTPKVEGFHFLATIEHTPAGNIVKKIPVLAAQMKGLLSSGPEEAQAAEALEAIDISEYRTVEPICEHCNKIRSRKDTYLVYNNETGEVKQVGRSCLRDYTGADNPEAIVKFLEMYYERMRGVNTERGREVILTREFLAHVAAVALPYQKGESKNWALDNIRDMKDDKRDPKTRERVYTIPEEKHYHIADEIIKWAREDWDATNDYALNVKIAIANEAVPEKGYGLVASVFAAKARVDREQEKREAEAKKERGHIGTVGERIEFEATITRMTPRDSDYSTDAWTIRFEDEPGNRIVWFASNTPRVKGESKRAFATEGITYKVRATIKKHDDSERYGKSTIITRAALLHSINEPDIEESEKDDEYAGPEFNQKGRWE